MTGGKSNSDMAHMLTIEYMKQNNLFDKSIDVSNIADNYLKIYRKFFDVFNSKKTK